jgi:hypothetical protein
VTRSALQILVISLATICCFIQPSRAESNADLSLEMYDRGDQAARETFELGILMIETGFEWANADLQFRKTQQLFCLPGKLAFTSFQLIKILRRGIQEDQRLAKHPLGFALLVSMKRVFPCP